MDDLFATVGVEAAWQVTDLTSGATLGQHADEPLPMVSLSKVVQALVVFRLADGRELDPSQPVTLLPDGRAHGTTGISAMADPVTLSLRDAAYLALTISDNAAGDALFDATGPATIADHLHGLDLDEIHVLEPMRDLYDRVDGNDPDPFAAPSTNTATPRSLVRLLELIWTDRAASAESCAMLRDLMARQVWQQRLASAFPAPDITVAGKTATAAGLRHEIGVITYPGPRPYAAAILTNSLLAQPDHRADATIGEAARRGIHQLRRPR